MSEHVQNGKCANNEQEFVDSHPTSISDGFVEASVFVVLYAS